ncbi:hypothetical protein GCM10023196_089150 [Actinoallomurus vinaceus]|uniref:Uncharacterized protein n=1 Tax=Actinoallomurus vinaceus TaxID=1080074 RepID=A0ABP8UQJ0_9ACTN
MTDPRWRELSPADPVMVRAARAHLTGEFSRGVDRLMWETHERPLGDVQSVRAVIQAASGGGAVDVTGLGAALLLIRAIRLDVDRLEWELLESARAAGLGWESIAAVMDLSGAAEAQERHRWLDSRRAEPAAPAERLDLSAPDGVPRAERMRLP